MRHSPRFLLFGVALAAATATTASFVPTGAAAPARPATFVQATVDGEQYTIDVKTPPVKVNEADEFTVTVKAKAGYKFNEAFPTKLKLSDPPAGLEFPKRKLKKGDGKLGDGGKSFTFAVPVKATRAGAFPFEAVIKFSVCNDSKCVVQRKTLKSKISAQ